MKILILNNLYFPYQRGGAERIAEISAQELQEAGHEVSVISTYPKKARQPEKEISGNYYLPSSYYHLRDKNLGSRLLWQIGNLFNWRQARRLTTIFAKEKPDLIIAHNLMGLGMLTPLAVKKSKAAFILTLHDIQLLHPSGLMFFGQEKLINTGAAKIYQAIIRKLLSLGPTDTIVISPSHWLLDLYRQKKIFGSFKMSVLTNPILPIVKQAQERENYFLFIGQLEWHKGIDLLIEAAKRFPEYRFLIIGDGHFKNDSSQGANIEFLGRQSAEEVNYYLARCQALIVPSRCYENSPTVIYEAAALGAPVLAAALGGIPELVARWGGLLFTPDDVDSLVMAISEFIQKGAPPISDTPSEKYSEKLLSLLN